MAHVPKNGRQGCKEPVVDKGDHRWKMPLPGYLYLSHWIFVFFSVFAFTGYLYLYLLSIGICICTYTPWIFVFVSVFALQRCYICLVLYVMVQCPLWCICLWCSGICPPALPGAWIIRGAICFNPRAVHPLEKKMHVEIKEKMQT